MQPLAKRNNNNRTIISTQEEQALACRYHEHNDLSAAKELVIAHLNVVERIAKGYDGYGLPFEDLVQEGTIGLMKAVRRFDPSKGFRLVTFAMHWIKASIHDFVLKNTQIVRLGTTKSQRKLFFNKGRWRGSEQGALSQESIAEIAKEYDVPAYEVETMERRLYAGDLSLNLPAKKHGDDSEKDTLQDQLESKSDPGEIVINEDHENWSKQQLMKSIEQLNKREQIIIHQRVLSESKKPLVKLGNDFGVSTERVRQIEQQALKKLRQTMTVA